MNQSVLVLRHFIEYHYDTIQNEIKHCMNALPVVSKKIRSRHLTEDDLELARTADGWIHGWTDNWFVLGFVLKGQQLPTASYCPSIVRCIVNTIINDACILVGLSWLKPSCLIPFHTDEEGTAPDKLRYRLFLYGILVPDGCWVDSKNMKRNIKQKTIIELDPHAEYSIGNDSDQDQVMLYIKVLDLD